MEPIPSSHAGTEAPSSFRSQPTSRPGRWARTALLVLAGIFFLTSALTGIFGRREAGSTIDEVMQVTGPLLGIAFVGAGLSALILALRAIVAHRERSFVVWIALLFGSLAALFLVGELLLPH